MVKEIDEIIKKVVCDKDGDAFTEMLCLPDKELENVIERMKELTTSDKKEEE